MRGVGKTDTKHIIVKVFRNRLAYNGGAKRNITRGNSFCHTHNIRCYIMMINAKPFAGTAKTAHHFIGYQQDTVFIRHCLYLLPVIGRVFYATR